MSIIIKGQQLWSVACRSVVVALTDGWMDGWMCVPCNVWQHSMVLVMVQCLTRVCHYEGANSM